MIERCSAFACPPGGCDPCPYYEEKSEERDVDDRGAILSDEPEPLYRYVLWRRWRTHGATALFIGLNPSTADTQEDDQTIRRCRTLAQLWGYSGIVMANLYALRSKDPTALGSAPDPIGPHCDEWLRRLIGRASLTVACWGAHVEPVAGRRRQLFLDVLPRMHVLGFTADGSPRHPSRMPNIPAPIPWKQTWTPADMPCATALPSKNDPDAVCGHPFRNHAGEHGPCIEHALSQAKTQKGKRLEGAVCPCDSFTRPGT